MFFNLRIRHEVSRCSKKYILPKEQDGNCFYNDSFNIYFGEETKKCIEKEQDPVSL
jgi:hypothetical protein